MKYAKVEKHALKSFSVYIFCIGNDIITRLPTEGLLSLHTWPKGSLSYVGIVNGQNPPGGDYKCIWLYTEKFMFVVNGLAGLSMDSHNYIHNKLTLEPSHRRERSQQ